MEGVINSFVKNKSTFYGLSQTLYEREWSNITSVSEDLTAAVNHIVERNIIFLGNMDKLCHKSYGACLGHNELLIKTNPVMNTLH